MASQSKDFPRKYDGSGTLGFISGESIDCNFELTQLSDGKIRLNSVTHLFSETFRSILSKESNTSKISLSEASLTGSTSDGGQISIQKMVLNTTSIHGSPQGFEGTFEFVINSDVSIQYQELSDDSIVTFVWGLSNFEFVGCEWSTYDRNKRLDKFSVSLRGFSITFTQVSGYREEISKLNSTEDVFVTSEASCASKISELVSLTEIIGKASVFCRTVFPIGLQHFMWIS